MTNLRWKIVTVLAVFIIFFAVGPYPILAARYHLPAPGWLMDKQLKLGLDLKGGVHLVLRVQTEDALRLETDLESERLRDALRTAQHPGERGAGQFHAVPGGRRAAGTGRRVPDGGERGPDQLRAQLRDQRLLYVHDEAERPGEPARRRRSCRRARRSSGASTSWA